MYINLKSIQQLFIKKESELFTDDSHYCLTEFTLLKNAYLPFDTYTIYITDNINELSEISPIPHMNLIILTDNLNKDNLLLPNNFNSVPVNFLFIRDMDLTLTISILRSFFHLQYGSGLFADSLLDVLFNESGIQTMIDRVAFAFQNPVFIFDAGFHLIAYTKKYIKNDHFEKFLIENGELTNEAFEILNKQNNIHEKVKRSETPVLVFHPELGFEQLVCTLDTQKDIGHIVLNASLHPFSDEDSRLLLILKKAINQQMKKDTFIKNSKGFQYEYFLKDLIDGRIATGKHLLSRKKYIETEFTGSLYCIVIETARSSSTLNSNHIRFTFESSFPDTLTLMHNGSIVVLLRLRKRSLLTDKDFEIIENLCIKYEIYAGMSNRFQNIIDLPDFFNQALHALELGAKDDKSPGLYVYENYFFQHMSNIFKQKENLHTFCNPRLQILLNFDEENKTELAYTLYNFLKYERNILTSSAKMNIHRNTLRNRLEKIDSLVNINYESFQERLYIILSYESIINNDTTKEF